MVEQLRQQHVATLAMLTFVVEAVDEELWNREFDGHGFWREAYHAAFWLVNFLGGPTRTFDPHPFGVDIDPRLFTPPNNACTLQEMHRFLHAAVEHVEQTFATLREEDLDAPDAFGEFDTVLRRILYGLVHVQHHVGKLTAWLAVAGRPTDPWTA